MGCPFLLGSILLFLSGATGHKQLRAEVVGSDLHLPKITFEDVVPLPQLWSVREI
jgi:hypothetical protein